MSRSIAALLLAGGSSTLLGAATLTAQAAPARVTTRVPVTLVIVDRLPVPEASFVVQRRPDAAPADVILLTAASQPSDLNDAIQTLIFARQAGGDLPTMGGIFRVRPQTHGQPVRSREFPWVPRVLNDLHQAPAQDVVGVGHVPAVQIWLPRQRPGPAR